MAEHTVYHPRLEGVVRTVTSDAARKAHKAAGWRMTPKGEDDREAAKAEPVVEPPVTS